MKKQTAQQQVKEFCRQVGLTVDGKNGVPTISKHFGNDQWFIECFETWSDAVKFLTNEKNALSLSGKLPAYCVANYK